MAQYSDEAGVARVRDVSVFPWQWKYDTMIIKSGRREPPYNVFSHRETVDVL